MADLFSFSQPFAGTDEPFLEPVTHSSFAHFDQFHANRYGKPYFQKEAKVETRLYLPFILPQVIRDAAGAFKCSFDGFILEMGIDLPFGFKTEDPLRFCNGYRSSNEKSGDIVFVTVVEDGGYYLMDLNHGDAKDFLLDGHGLYFHLTFMPPCRVIIFRTTSPLRSSPPSRSDRRESPHIPSPLRQPSGNRCHHRKHSTDSDRFFHRPTVRWSSR